MRISRTRKLVVDLGNYEKIEFSVTVTMGHDDLGYTDEEIASICESAEDRRALQDEIIDEILQCLERQLQAEIQAATPLTDNEKSVLIREMRAHHERATPKKRS